MILAEFVKHREQERIKLNFPYENALVERVRQIAGRLWSKTMGAWHIPYTKDAWAQFKALFREYEYRKRDGELVVVSEDKVLEKQAVMPEKVAKIAIEKGGIIQEKTVAISKENIPVKIPKKVIISHLEHNSQWLQVQLPPDLCGKYLASIRQIHGQRWNQHTTKWEIPYTKISLRFLQKYILQEDLHFNFLPETDIPETVNFEIKKTYFPQNAVLAIKYESEVLRLEEQLMLKRYSYKTIKTYKNIFRQFLQFYDDIAPPEITEAQIRKFLLEKVHQKVSESFQNQIINAIKFYYEKVLGQERKTYYLPRPKKAEQLPNVLSEEEVLLLLNATNNLKHRCMLMLAYSGGLRLSEIVNLKIKDINSAQNCIFVKAGKGKKDRTTLLSNKVLIALREYYEVYTPIDFLFEGQGGGQYSPRSVQNIFTAAKEKSGINAYATLHTLRHSFATHLLEHGVSLVYIKDLLGHNSIKTTEIYTHITTKAKANIRSPLDNLPI